MADVCNPSNQIGNYAPSSTGGNGDAFFKNVDAVNVNADLVACGTLTIDGEIFDATVLDSKTQNINEDLTSPGTTQIDGVLSVDSIVATTLNATTCRASMITNNGAFTQTGTSYLQGNVEIASTKNLTFKTSTVGSDYIMNTNPTEFRLTLPTSGALSIVNGSTETARLNSSGFQVTGSSFTLNSIPQSSVRTAQISAQTGTSTVTVPLPSNAYSCIKLFLSNVGLSTNTNIFFQVASATSSPTYLATGYYCAGENTTDQKWNVNNGAGIRLLNSLDNNEGVHGVITIERPYGQGTQWYVNCDLFSTTGSVVDCLKTVGIINANQTIGTIQFNGNGGLFNRGGSYVYAVLSNYNC